MARSFGSWAFLIGIVLAVIFGFIGSLSNTIIITLFAIGIIVGLLNVTDKEVTPCLMEGTVLVIVSSLGSQYMGSVEWIKNILGASMIIFVPATVVVAVKSVFGMAKH